MVKFKAGVTTEKKEHLRECGIFIGARQLGPSISEIDPLGISHTAVSSVYREWFGKEKMAASGTLARCITMLRSRQNSLNLLAPNNELTVV